MLDRIFLLAALAFLALLVLVLLCLTPERFVAGNALVHAVGDRACIRLDHRRLLRFEDVFRDRA